MSRLETIVESLKSLPAVKLQMAADYIEQLQRAHENQRRLVLARTSGSLPDDVVSDIESAIEEGCEKIDECG